MNTSCRNHAEEKESIKSCKEELIQELDPTHNLFLNPTHHFQSINVPSSPSQYYHSTTPSERCDQNLTPSKSPHLKQNTSPKSLSIPPSSLSAASFTTNSKLSSFKSISNKKINNTNTEHNTEQTSVSLSTSPQAQTNIQTSQHLSPSPLAICDGLTITYGNPNTTQTFKPSTVACSSSKSFKETMSSLNEEKHVETAPEISLSTSPTQSCPK